MLIIRYAMLAAGCLTIAPAVESVRVVHGGRSFTASSRLPVMSRGYLFFIERSPFISVYDSSGRPAFTIELKSPTRSLVTPSDAAMSAHGQTAVSFVYTNDASEYQGAIAFFDNAGKQTSLIKTGRFTPAHLCFAPDGTIWAAGWQRDAVKRDYEDEQDYILFANGMGKEN
jgi:hypothetical protein